MHTEGVYLIRCQVEKITCGKWQSPDGSFLPTVKVPDNAQISPCKGLSANGKRIDC